MSERWFAVRALVGDEAQVLLSAVLSSVDFGVFITALDHTSLAANTPFGEIFGLDIGLVIQNDAQKVREMVERRIEDFPAWEANLQKVYSDPSMRQTDELRLKNPFSLIRRVTLPIQDASGNIIGRLWMFEDITHERKLMGMRQVLHEASLLFDEVPSEVYTRLTQAVGSYYGSLSFLSIRVGDYLEFRAVGGPPGPGHDLQGNLVRDSFCQFCLEESGPVLIQDARQHDRAKSLFPVDLGFTRYAGVPLKNPEGSTIGTLCILDDRSEELLDDEDLSFLSMVAMRISSELDREVQLAALQHDLAETRERLLQSEKLAIAGTLSASIAHDIRNILAAISLELDMGAKNPRSTLESVQGHLDRFHVLASRLLSYAKPHQLVREPVNLSESILRSVALLSAHAKLKNIQMEVVGHSNDIVVTADQARLDHLFVNLLLNAIEAMCAGGKVLVTLKRRDCSVEVTVADSGPGIPPDKLDTLFEPFSSSRRDGFGLGLFSCHQIVTEIGGDISVESEPGQGTTFFVRLPIPCPNHS